MRISRPVLSITICACLLGTGCNSNLLSNLFGGGSTTGVDEFLPTDITLETDELPDTDGTSDKAAGSDLLFTGAAAHDSAFRLNGAILHAFHRLAGRALVLGAAVRNDISSETQTQVTGTLLVGGQEVSYKADFAAFDIDGDSVADGSGGPNEAPVAMRMWVDRGNGFERFLCALVTTRPTSNNIGAGMMYTHPDAARADAADDLQMMVAWDRTDDAHKWNEAFIAGQVRTNYSMIIGHHRVDHRSFLDTSIESTVRSSAQFDNSPFGFETLASSTHWQRGSGFALINAEATGGSNQINLDNVCVDLSDNSLAIGQCDNYQTDAADYSELPQPTGDEAGFPAGFPADPTF